MATRWIFLLALRYDAIYFFFLKILRHQLAVKIARLAIFAKVTRHAQTISPQKINSLNFSDFLCDFFVDRVAPMKMVTRAIFACTLAWELIFRRYCTHPVISLPLVQKHCAFAAHLPSLRYLPCSLQRKRLRS